MRDILAKYIKPIIINLFISNKNIYIEYKLRKI